MPDCAMSPEFGCGRLNCQLVLESSIVDVRRSIPHWQKHVYPVTGSDPPMCAAVVVASEPTGPARELTRCRFHDNRRRSPRWKHYSHKECSELRRKLHARKVIGLSGCRCRATCPSESAQWLIRTR